MNDRLSGAQLAELTKGELRVADRQFQAYREETREHLTTIASLRAEVTALKAEVQAHRAAKAAEHASAEALAGMMPLGGGEP